MMEALAISASLVLNNRFPPEFVLDNHYLSKIYTHIKRFFHLILGFHFELLLLWKMQS
jgi:hypothetical protein